MNKEEKRAVFIALANRQILKDEAKKVLSSDPKDRVFKNLIYPDGRIETLPFGDNSLKRIFEKIGVSFITVNRIIIQKKEIK